MRASKTWLAAGVLVMLAPVPVSAGTAEDANPLTVWSWVEEARSALSEERWQEAESHLERLTTLHPEDGRRWLELARVRERQGKTEKTLEPLLRARELGFVEPGEGALRLARAYAEIGRQDQAMEWLETALATGYRFRDAALGDKAFAAIAESPRFQALSGPAEPFPSRDAGWRSDLGFLVAEIERVHYRFRDRPLPRSFRDEVRHLEQEIPRLDDGALVIRLQRLMASLGDGHSLLWPFGMRKGELQRYPVGLWWFADGVYVIRSREDRPELLGQQVVAIAGVPVAEVLERLTPWVSHDNEWGFRWVAPVYITLVEVLEAAGLPAASSGRWTFEDGTGRRSEIELVPSAVDPGEIPLGLIPPESPVEEGVPAYLSRLATPIWWQPLEDGHTLYVQCNRITDGPDRSLAEGAEMLRENLGRDVDTLILDVRHNSGGDAAVLPELVRTLIHFETTRPQGRLYVLLSRNTFSAAQTLVNLAEQLTGAVFVGEPPGTRPNRLGNEAPLELPYSGVRGTLSSGYNQGASSRDHRHWIAPDLPVPLRASDYFAGRDPVLEAVLAIEKRRRNRTNAGAPQRPSQGP